MRSIAVSVGDCLVNDRTVSHFLRCALAQGAPTRHRRWMCVKPHCLQSATQRSPTRVWGRQVVSVRMGEGDHCTVRSQSLLSKVRREISDLKPGPNTWQLKMNSTLSWLISLVWQQTGKRYVSTELTSTLTREPSPRAVPQSCSHTVRTG